MAQKIDPLKKARRALNKHKFPQVIKILLPYVIDYRDSFDFYYILGTACLYVGDIGGAEAYYAKARKIKMIDVNLITAQAVLFLRRGQVNRAVEYYLEAQDYDSTNKLAKKGLDFIRYNNTPEKIHSAVLTKKIEKLYPNCTSFPIKKYLISLASFSIVFILCFFILIPKFLPSQQMRADLSDLVLTVEDRNNSLETDLSTENYRYILTKDQISQSYEKAQKYFQIYKDNAAQVEINRILNSNASASIRQKARLLMDYFETPGFDTLKDNFTYAQVAEDPYLYIDCWVEWSGRITNVEETALEYHCDFLAGYDELKEVEGIIPLVFDQPVTINTVQPLTILAKIGIQDGKLFLKGNSIFQSINKE